MKSRINIWNERGANKPQETPKSNPNQKNAKKIREQDQTPRIQQNHNPRNKPSFEYEAIQDVEPLREGNFNGIEHEEGDYPPMERRGGGGILKKSQKRRNSLSIAVSEEEHELLKQAAIDKGMTFSNWARKTLFRSAGIRMPKRPK